MLMNKYFVYVILQFCGIASLSQANYKHIPDNYEIADCEILNLRNKRDFSHRDKRDAKLSDSHAEIRIRSPQKMFHLVLMEDDSFKNMPIQINGSVYLQKHFNNSAKFYEGALKDGTQSSFAMGFLHDEVFSGSVFDGGEMFFVEPANKFFKRFNDSKKVMLYKSLHFNSTNLETSRLSYREPNFPHESAKILQQGIDISQGYDLFCEMELVVDHLLYQFFKWDMGKLASYLYYHVKHTDKIFRDTDFNFDGRPERIRLSVKKMHVYQSANDPNYPMNPATEMTDYMNKKLYRIQDDRYCLSYSLTYRNWKGGKLGEAWMPLYLQYGVQKGICDLPRRDTNQRSIQYNTGIINFRYEDYGPLRDLELTVIGFAHEVAHSFGSDHDPKGSAICSFREHVVFPVTTPESPYSNVLSICSRKDIWRALQVKGECMKPKGPQCGNMIREGDEECDCGSSATCQFVDPCCIAVDTYPAEKGCKLRTDYNIKCSPKENNCCDQSCKIVTDRRQCYIDHVQCVKSFCDGYSAVCPPPKRYYVTPCFGYPGQPNPAVLNETAEVLRKKKFSGASVTNKIHFQSRLFLLTLVILKQTYFVSLFL